MREYKYYILSGNFGKIINQKGKKKMYTLTQEKKMMIAATLLNWTCRLAKNSKLG